MDANKPRMDTNGTVGRGSRSANKDFAPKGQLDSAQGFNPGLPRPRWPALKVAAEGRDEDLLYRLAPPKRDITQLPGLKPWAESWRPFGAKLTRLAL
jgi:hypothetical protein